MKRFLLLACLVGAAVYVLNLPRTPTEEGELAVSATQTQADNLAAQTQTGNEGRGPLRSSWGSNLRSIGQEPEVSKSGSKQPATSETTSHAPRPETENQGSEPTPSAQPSALDQASAPVRDDTEREAVEWVKMTQGLRTRSKASLSSPLLRYYPKGSRAQVVGRANGWVQLLDPTTQERGWVYHTYLASIDDPGEMQPKMARKPPTVKVAPPTSRKPISRQPTRTAKTAVRTSDAVDVPEAKRRHDQKAWRMRRRGLGLFGRRKARQP